MAKNYTISYQSTDVDQDTTINLKLETKFKGIVAESKIIPLVVKKIIPPTGLVTSITSATVKSGQAQEFTVTIPNNCTLEYNLNPNVGTIISTNNSDTNYTIKYTAGEVDKETSVNITLNIKYKDKVGETKNVVISIPQPMKEFTGHNINTGYKVFKHRVFTDDFENGSQYASYVSADYNFVINNEFYRTTDVYTPTNGNYSNCVLLLEKVTKETAPTPYEYRDLTETNGQPKVTVRSLDNLPAVTDEQLYLKCTITDADVSKTAIVVGGINSCGRKIQWVGTNKNNPGSLTVEIMDREKYSFTGLFSKMPSCLSGKAEVRINTDIDTTGIYYYENGELRRHRLYGQYGSEGNKWATGILLSYYDNPLYATGSMGNGMQNGVFGYYYGFKTQSPGTFYNINSLKQNEVRQYPNL